MSWNEYIAPTSDKPSGAQRRKALRQAGVPVTQTPVKRGRNARPLDGATLTTQEQADIDRLTAHVAATVAEVLTEQEPSNIDRLATAAAEVDWHANVTAALAGQEKPKRVRVKKAKPEVVA